MSFPGMAMQRTWHLLDARNQKVGRLANQIAQLLLGKHKPTYLPGRDMGDMVVVVNAEKVAFSGKKWKEKLYRWHTGYPGGLKQRTAKEMLEKNPTQILRKAVLGMMKRNKFRHHYVEPRLKIYLGPEHPHHAQLAGVNPLPPVPKRRRGDWHYGLIHYADPNSFLVNRNEHPIFRKKRYLKNVEKMKAREAAGKTSAAATGAEGTAETTTTTEA
jgi:large subunit ribosomal protein L13